MSKHQDVIAYYDYGFVNARSFNDASIKDVLEYPGVYPYIVLARTADSPYITIWSRDNATIKDQNTLVSTVI